MVVATVLVIRWIFDRVRILGHISVLFAAVGIIAHSGHIR